jgi:hypothetical protein
MEYLCEEDPAPGGGRGMELACNASARVGAVRLVRLPCKLGCVDAWGSGRRISLIILVSSTLAILAS